jgi:REP element-mobilizing transposase RayT
MKPLTRRQSTVLEFVAKYSNRRGFPPTLREIGGGTGLSNISAVRGHIFARTDKGVLHKIIYGVALATRKHRDYFVGERKRWIDKALKRRAVEHGWTFLRKQIEPDHIVLVVEVWPNHSPELVVSRIRQSGNRIRLRHIKHFPGKSLWAKGYVATTNLESLDDMVSELLQDTLYR